MFITEIVKRIWKIALGLFLLPFGTFVALIYIVVSLFTLKVPDLQEDIAQIPKHNLIMIKEGITG